MNQLPRYLATILRYRKLVLLNTAVLTALGVAVSFMLPKQYTATAQLLPPSADDDMFGLSGSGLLGGAPGSLRRLARVGAMSGEGTASDVMVGILASRTILDRVAQRCSVAFHYRIKLTRTEAVRQQLVRMSNLAVGDEGIIRVRVEARTPRLAADIANAYVAELDSFMRTSNMSRGRTMRVFLDRRVAEVESALAVSSESLRSFQERHHVAAVDRETEAAIDAYAKMKSEAYVRQAALEAVASAAGPDNPYAAGLRRELAAFREQLRRLERGTGGTGYGVGFAVSFEHLPGVVAEYARRYRDHRILEETYAMLSQQHEYAKVLEARDAPTLTVLDYAVPPQRKSSPKRTVITGALLLLGLMGSIAFAFTAEYFEHLRRHRPDEYDAWSGVRMQAVSAVRPLLSLFGHGRHRAR